MTAPMLFGLAALLVLVAGSAWQSWRARIRLLARLRAEWGHPCARPRDMESVADFFRLHDADGACIDDRTWTDLGLDDVFAHLDRTESAVGQQMLYRRLRSTLSTGTLDVFDALVARVGDDTGRREQTQRVLARLGNASAYFVHRLTRPDGLERRWWHAVFPIWTVAVILTLLVGIVWPTAALSTAKALIVAAFGFVLNKGILIVLTRRSGGQLVWLRSVGPLLSAARALGFVGTAQTAAITGSLMPDLAALRRLGVIARWVSRDPLATDGLTFVILEFMNALFLIDANALYFASHELRSRAPNLLRVIKVVGEIDAAIAIASFRTGTDGWIRPRFTSPEASATFVDLRHLLLEEPVPNSIALAPPHGVLVTGSNMSGKSTFLRTVGVNVVLAQSIDTCLARRYEAPIYNVRSCIGRADDLIAGKSYYLVEVESVLALVKASEETQPHLFIFDELFRGTNAVERIAAGEAVLRTLIAEGRPHVVLAATHDAEMVDLLSERYVVYHLRDAIGPNGLTFDYRLTPGPATSRNAIALLKLNGAPESLVAHALDRAAALDKQRQLLL